jgi:hypothetical protein
MELEPTLGFEPRTCCLRNSCSTAELCRRRSRVADAQQHQLFALVQTLSSVMRRTRHNARTADNCKEHGPQAMGTRFEVRTAVRSAQRRNREHSTVVVESEAIDMILRSARRRRRPPVAAAGLTALRPETRSGSTATSGAGGGRNERRYGQMKPNRSKSTTTLSSGLGPGAPRSSDVMCATRWNVATPIFCPDAV